MERKMNKIDSLLIDLILILIIIILFKTIGYLYIVSDNLTDIRLSTKTEGELSPKYSVLSPDEKYLAYSVFGYDGDEKYLTFAIVDNQAKSVLEFDDIAYVWKGQVKFNNKDYIKWYDESTICCYASNTDEYFYVYLLDGVWKESGWLKGENEWKVD